MSLVKGSNSVVFRAKRNESFGGGNQTSIERTLEVEQPNIPVIFVSRNDFVEQNPYFVIPTSVVEVVPIFTGITFDHQFVSNGTRCGGAWYLQ